MNYYHEYTFLYEKKGKWYYQLCVVKDFLNTKYADIPQKYKQES